MQLIIYNLHNKQMCLWLDMTSWFGLEVIFRDHPVHPPAVDRGVFHWLSSSNSPFRTLLQSSVQAWPTLQISTFHLPPVYKYHFVSHSIPRTSWLLNLSFPSRLWKYYETRDHLIWKNSKFESAVNFKKSSCQIGKWPFFKPFFWLMKLFWQLNSSFSLHPVLRSEGRS